MYFFPFLDVPSAPTGVHLSNIDSRAVEISWVRPHDGNSPILNYIIEYSNLPGNKILYYNSSNTWVELKILLWFCPLKCN